MLFRSLPIVSLVVTALSTLAIGPVLGQTLPDSISPGDAVPAQPPQSYSMIHVNAVSGSDTSGDGSQLRPWQTITHALQVAAANSVIILAPGVYSDASGENFPLRLKPGVTVQGSATPGINNAVIRGSGTFPSASGTYMQVTVVAVDGAGLAHVTITNSSSSGYGLVVESGSPTIHGNHFIGSGYAGAYAAGTGSPLFEQNYFSENRSVGLVIAGQSRAEVQDNTFENTGTGIQVEPGAQPILANNRIVSNRAGLVVAANARPQLQNNEIVQNRHNGLVEFAAANKTVMSSAPLPPSAPLPLRAAAGGPSSEPTVPPAPMAQSPAFSQPALEPPPQASQVQQIASPPAINRSTRPLASPPAVSPASAAVTTSPGDPTDNQPSDLATLSAPPEFRGLAAQPFRGALTTAVEATADAASEPAPSTARPQNLPLSLPLAAALDVLEMPQSHTVTSDIQSSAAEMVTATDLTDEDETPTLAEPSADSSPAPEINEESHASASETATVAEASNPLTSEIADADEASNPATSELDSSAPEPTVAETSGRRTAPGRRHAATSETAVPLQVIPPSVELSARAQAGSLEEDSSTRSERSAANPEQLERLDRLPTLPPVDPNSSGLLQVPDMTIPAGNGRHNVPVLATGSADPGVTAEATTEGPPAPPSRATMLGLLYRVLVPSTDEAGQNRLRELVPDAFRVEFEGQRMMQAGAYPTQEEAEATAARLQEQGLDAQVVYVP